MMSLEQITSLERLSKIFESGKANQEQIQELSSLIRHLSLNDKSNLEKNSLHNSPTNDMT